MRSGCVKSTDLIPRLLSRENRLSRSEKDEILANVLHSVASGRPRLRRIAPALAVAVAAAALALIVLVIDGRGTGSTEGQFASRGQGASAGAFTLSCSICRRDETLVFDLTATAGYPYFAAFATHEDGTVVWYFPESADGHSVDLRERLRDGLLDRGVALGRNHPRGSYRVYGIFSHQPLSRRAIRDRFDEGAADLGAGTSVVTREFSIQ